MASMIGFAESAHQGTMSPRVDRQAWVPCLRHLRRGRQPMISERVCAELAHSVNCSFWSEIAWVELLKAEAHLEVS